jgi:hypothetical protein
MITNRDKMVEIRRELKVRREVYPRLVADRRLKQEDADRRIAIMTAILEDYREALQGGKQEGSLL